MPSYLDILQSFGTKIETYKHSLPNALELAKGSLPLVVVMQEPCNLADTVPYEYMVYGDESAQNDTVESVGCPALQEVERLAEDASKCKYSLKDLSVFDLNTLHSPDMQDDSNDIRADLFAAHETFWRMIQAKAPQVILVLTCKARSSEDKFVRLLWSSLKSAGRKDSILIRTDSGWRPATVIRAFHPSVYLRDDYTSDQSWSPAEIQLANQVLLYCFEMAFHCLSEDSHAMVDKEYLLKAWRKQVQAQQEMQSIEKDFESLKLCAGLTE